MDLLTTVIKASLEAGKAIKELYITGKIETQVKEDMSPVTNADLASNKIITNHLLNTGIPILSEENNLIPYNERKNWDRLWIVDPLDGTKEFLKRNGEFTVNIALIKDKIPVLGVIYAPVTGELYFGSSDRGSNKICVEDPDSDIEKIIDNADKLPLIYAPIPNTVAVSRSHMNKSTENYIMSRSVTTEKPQFVSRGSSLKLCMVAEGTAGYYPRFGKTMEWDTAAGHAILRNAGKSLRRIDNGEELSYNKETPVNPDFIAE